MENEMEFINAGAWIGRQQAFAVIATKATAAQALALRQVKEHRYFEKLGISWEQFCLEYAGICRSQADTLIQRLQELGENYFRISEITRISPDVYRRLADKIDGDSIELDGEKIDLTIANAPRIRATVRQLRQELRAAREGAALARHPDTSHLISRIDSLIDAAASRQQQYIHAGRSDEFRAVVGYAIEKWTALANEVPIDPGTAGSRQ